MSETWLDEVERVARAIRLRAARVCIANAGGYLVQACGAADILAALYVRLLDLGPSSGPGRPPPFAGVPTPAGTSHGGAAYHGDRDRFIVSPAHYALGVYAALVEVERLDDDVLGGTNADGSTLEMIGAEHSPGFETTSGALGQALSVAVGQALVRQRFDRPGYVWVLLSDGELEEGQTWEALAAAAHYGLDGLTILLDANGEQVDGRVADVMGVEPIAERVRAFGATAYDVDGHDPAAIVAAATDRVPGRPTFVICRTSATTVLPSLSGRHQIHYLRFRPGEAEAVLADLGASTEALA